MTKTRDLADLGGGFIQAGTGAVQRTVESRLQDVVSVLDFIPQSEHAAIKAGTSTYDTTTAIQAAFNSSFGCIFFPQGNYKITSTVTASTDKRITGARQQSSVITLHTSTAGTVAIRAESTRFQFDNISINSNSGTGDGLATVGFYHSRPGGGSSVGRITHSNFTMAGFSEAAIIVDQAISYGICDGTIACGKYGIVIRPHIDTSTISTSVTLQNLYLDGGDAANIYLDRVSDTTLIKCINENGGSSAITNSAALYNSLGRVRCLGCYFEQNYRNVYTDQAIIEIGSFVGSETASSIYTFTPATALTSRGNVFITQNRVTTRYLDADTSYLNYIEVQSPIVSNSDIVSNNGNIRAGNSSLAGRVDNVTLGLTASVNASNLTARDTIGSVINLGISYSTSSATGRWMQLKQCMNASNTDHRLDFIRMTGDYYNPTAGTESIVFRLFSTSVRPGADGTISLGAAGARYSEVFASTGTINTSDEREKQDISDLDDAEKEVAATLKSLVKKYRFKDAVQRKGDEARIHVGVIAQDVVTAFAAKGLDATRYGILCHNEWYELDGDEVTADEDGSYPEGAIRRDRYGIRYEELLAFIISTL